MHYPRASKQQRYVFSIDQSQHSPEAILSIILQFLFFRPFRLYVHEIKLIPSFSTPVRQNYSTSQWISRSLRLVSTGRLRSESEHTVNPLLNQKSLKTKLCVLLDSWCLLLQSSLARAAVLLIHTKSVTCWSETSVADPPL